MTTKRIKKIQEKYTEPRSKSVTQSKTTKAPAMVEVLIEPVETPKRAANSELLAAAVVIVTIFYFATEYLLPSAIVYPSNVDLLADMGLVVVTLFSVFWIFSRAWALVQHFQALKR